MRRWQLIFLFIVLLLGGLELVFRAATDFHALRPSEQRKTGPTYEPSKFDTWVFPAAAQDLRFAIPGWGDVHYRLDANGFRGAGFSEVPAPGTKRIFIYGGSAIFDILMNEGEHWPAKVEKLLRARGHNVEVINAGVPGTAAYAILLRLLFEDHRFRPHIVLVASAWNDMSYFSTDRPLLRGKPDAGALGPAFNPFRRYYSRLDYYLAENSAFYVNLRAYYLRWKFARHLAAQSLFRDQSVDAWKVGESEPAAPGLVQYRANLAGIVDAARNAGARAVLFTEPNLACPTDDPKRKEKAVRSYAINYLGLKLNFDGMVKSLQRAHDVAREVARAKKAPLIDAAAKISCHDEWFWDGIHLNREGSDAMAELVAGQLEKELGRR